MNTKPTPYRVRWAYIAISCLLLLNCASMDGKQGPSPGTRFSTLPEDSHGPTTAPPPPKEEPKIMVYSNADLQPQTPDQATIPMRGESVRIAGRQPPPALPDYRKQVQPAQWQAKNKSPADGEVSVEFNFDNANLTEVLRTIAQILDIKYIAETGIQGTVTIHTAKGLLKKDLFPIFFRILEVNGLVAVKEGEFYRITTAAKASRLPVPLRLDPQGRPLPQQEDVITQIIPVQHTSAAEMAKLITPFISENATLIPHVETNTLILVDKAINVMKALRLIDAFDLTVLTRQNHRFFFLQNADAENAVTVLNEVFGLTSPASKDQVKLIAIKRLNAFLAISTGDQVFGQIEGILAQLDSPSKGIEPRIFVYSVRNGAALNLSDLLNQVFNQIKSIKKSDADTAKPGSQGSPSLSRNPFAMKVSTSVEPQKPANVEADPAATPELGPVATSEARTLRGEIKITPDEIRNALIIEATPSDYRIIQDILNRIDVLPRQVLIEATIAEIDHNLTTELGVDWSYTKGVAVDNGILSASLTGASGLSLGLGIGSNLKATLKALERQNRVNILSSPHVLASDNQKARIDVSNEVPLVSSETVVTSGSQPIVTTNIQYRDTGVMLSVTPHINERALVTMDIYQEVSEQSDDVTVAGQSYPSFFKRTVETSLTVRHGQTIVLGGLIRENKSKSNAGLPLLSRLPLIGALFGQTKDVFDKTELIILLTPKVIIDLDDIDEVTNGFKDKVYSVVQNLQSSAIAY